CGICGKKDVQEKPQYGIGLASLYSGERLSLEPAD
ncbi:MAG: hypothetical protein PWQ59_1482, partial [Thermoanaerobacterium sp.]|nr:hypothetical protein [Thermoanaerobacterium sp.]